MHPEGATDVASATALLEQHQLLWMELEEQRNRWEHHSLTRSKQKNSRSILKKKEKHKTFFEVTILKFA